MTENAAIVNKLETMFEDEDDVTSPSAMDKVIMILEENQMEDEEYMELLKEKLRDQAITWTQPWYQASKSLTRKPKVSSDVEEEYETGTFTSDECERIAKNWRKFVRKFEVPNKPICLARWRNKGKSRKPSTPEEFVRFFVTAYLARGVKRDLYQVNRYFLQTYGYPVKQQKYSPIEEKVMEICFYHKPDHAVLTLSAVLGREPRAFYNRLTQYYNGKPEKKKLKWTLDLATQLINNLMLYSGCSVQELKNKQFDKSIWVQVEEVMGREYRYLQAYWYSKLHVQLFAQCTIKTKPLRKIICQKLQDAQYKVWRDICWKKLLLEFPDGFTQPFLYRMTKNMFQSNSNYLTSPLSEVIATALTKEWITRRLISLKLEEGILKSVRHELNLKDAMRQCYPMPIKCE